MIDLALDPTRSRVRIQTFSEGLFARLAHDLELSCGELVGTAAREGGAGERGSASIAAPLRGITVAGVLGKDGVVDERALSPAERRDCVAKMQADVFHGQPEDVVRIEARLEDGAARVRVVPPRGSPVEATVRPVLRAEGDAVHVSGSFGISLRAIGSDVVKGPMGAFRVKDEIKIHFDVAFYPA